MRKFRVPEETYLCKQLIVSLVVVIVVAYHVATLPWHDLLDHAVDATMDDPISIGVDGWVDGGWMGQLFLIVL